MSEKKLKYDVDPELLSDFLDESQESVAGLDTLFVQLEQQPANTKIIEQIFRVAHSIKGLAGFLNLTAIQKLTHELETVLAGLRDGKLTVDCEVVNVLLAGFDALANMLARLRAGQSQVENEQKLANLIRTIKNLTEMRPCTSEPQSSKRTGIGPDQTSRPAGPVEKLDKADDCILENLTTEKPPPSPQTVTGPRSRTMRVSEDKVDVFMQYVGDLIEVSESFNLLQRRTDNGSDRRLAREFKAINSSFNQLSDKLQKSLLEIRKVPARNLVQKVPRMVRDLAQSLGKKIRVSISGEETQVDKSLVEALESPINHIVRNCVDHGIEPPKQRQKAGKARTGNIDVNITEDTEQVVITIRDDGAGIDPAEIRRKAVEKSLVTVEQAAALSDRDVLRFVFSSGFSTAQKVTDISGRGVGMDVVKANVESLKGSITLDSTYGQGTLMTLRLPSSLTVLVVKGMLVSVGREQYIIELEDIQEILQPRPEEIVIFNDRTELLNLRSGVYPLVRLHRLFGIEPRVIHPADAIVILTQANGRGAAIMVDKILGRQRVVVKELEQRFSNLQTIAGSAILANTKVGLVLDMAGIINQCLGSKAVESRS